VSDAGHMRHAHELEQSARNSIAHFCLQRWNGQIGLIKGIVRLKLTVYAERILSVADYAL
jgi:hypothetical protein